MKVTDLNPQFVGMGGPHVRYEATGKTVPPREGVGMSFDCPCGCGTQGYVGFANPLDGGPSVHPAQGQWQRTGETFETITLTPSIYRPKPHGCGWHGYFTNGEVVPC